MSLIPVSDDSRIYFMPQTTKKTRVVIVDDHPLFRQGVRQAMAGATRLEICGEAGTGEEALELILKEKPDVAVLDLNLPILSGFEVVSALRAKKSKTAIVILTMVKEQQAFNKALNLGVSGYVLKENAAAEIINCITAVAAGDDYVSPSLTSFMLKRRNRADALAQNQPGLDDLTTAERRILKRIANGMTTREIAAEFFISPRTVDTHRSNICEKLQLSGSNRLLQFALQNRDALSHLD
jgi:DNA-binding NarL/FixJ family response regulator